MEQNTEPGLTTSESASDAGAQTPAATRQAPSLNGVSFSLPDLPSWTAEDYHSHIAGSGAEKLADSGVAPLVAAARGYKRIDHTNFAEELKTMGVKATTDQGRRWKASLAKPGKDAMQMPWYSVASLQIAERRQEELIPLTYQLRPEFPSFNKSGKPMKYEFVKDAVTPLDLHPATPVAWIDTTPVVMFAEGMLKGDAALSAYLHANGASWDELKSAGVADPVAALRTLMDRIPEEDRILIISIAGIHNAHQHPMDWREIALKGRIGWIAFDADLSVNPHVHAAAQKLFLQLDEKSKMSEILFLNPEINSGDDGEMAKAGVDDYLAKVGTWDQLVAQLTPNMPAAPPRSEEERPGNWRVSKNGLSVEECVAVNDGPGGSVGRYEWRTVVDLGGRILSRESVRQPTDQELRTGLFNPNVQLTDVEDSQVEVEVAWSGPGGSEQKAIVTGPEHILSYMPADWHRQGAVIPWDLQRHPYWPPRAQKGEAWITAVKAHRSEETVLKTKWMQMGWVPVEGGDPVYLIGDQVIGDADLNGTAVCGVDDRKVPVAQHYGVGDLVDGDYDDEAYREMVRRDFQAVVDAYVTNKAWTEDSTAALVLAVALRPTIPLRPRTSIYLWGPKGKGKSWTAQCMMYFWARTKSDWQDKLPGQAKDTAAAIENALAYTPIWVIDDMAPSSVKRQAEQEDAKLSDMTRAIFNNAGKGRMNADMTAKRTNKPMTQLIMTAENELTTPSAKERLIPVFIGPGKLNPSKAPTSHINKMARNDGVQARFTSHVLRYIRRSAIGTLGGWENYMTSLEEKRLQVQSTASTIMEKLGAASGSLERTTSLAADVLLTFEILKQLAQELDMGTDFIRLFSVNRLGGEIIQLVNKAHTENQQAAPGISLVRALSALLASGAAHVISGDDPNRPPIEGTDRGESLANHGLGWMGGSSDGTPRPGGMSIGTVITANDSDGVPRKVILFDVHTAFSKAQAAYPVLIPYGQGTGSAWASVWDEELAPSYIPRSRNSSGTLLSTVRRPVGDRRISGVPIEVDVILQGGKRIDESQEISEIE
ncbi:hypothetical protein [Arthrobacter sp. zg-Y1110]|uniref:hypothetical protein n=1 Tax=Arthrobacter sp. zg-Y1110 TaxID=2886932 RepID=UPI001D15361D|nr:hypothetical protein [Arthrobacter sp. zg-Y1110]MCC3292852.1 hypothetical protein [Arthrobacter sp. zg-Y1110]UWX86791.1 hypothetical protein N2K99_18280 [Arthrobacter sp. zg-Y1110]